MQFGVLYNSFHNLNNTFTCFINLTIFQVFVSLRQNDQELASMYDQVILINLDFGLCILLSHSGAQFHGNSFILPLFSAESHGQPQKLYGRSDGGGESCPRGQNFGKIQYELT